ncbi:MAG: Fur family transcriptional regulator [Pyrinomonadaceae bacterium]
MEDTGSLGLTRQREVILRVIREAEEHLTANAVFDSARRMLPGISFATVYNSLRYLKGEGLIGEVRFGADATLYDRNVSRHDHAICTVCGKLVDLELAVPAEIVKKGERLSKFKVKSIEMVLRGLCPDCR